MAANAESPSRAKAIWLYHINTRTSCQIPGRLSGQILESINKYVGAKFGEWWSEARGDGGREGGESI